MNKEQFIKELMKYVNFEVWGNNFPDLLKTFNQNVEGRLNSYSIDELFAIATDLELYELVNEVQKENKLKEETK